MLIPHSTTDICCSFSRNPLSNFFFFYVLIVDIGCWQSEAHPSLSPHEIQNRLGSYLCIRALAPSSCGGLSHRMYGTKIVLVALKPIKIQQHSSVSAVWGSHVEFREAILGMGNIKQFGLERNLRTI